MENENRETTALVVMPGQEVTAQAAPPPGYWARTAGRYKTVLRILSFVLAVFLVMFSVLFTDAFSYDSLFYFGRDFKTLATLAGIGDSTVYYDYMGEDALPVAYRGGVAVADTEGLSVFAANGELLLDAKTEHTYRMPRVAVSRDYLVVYDFGGNTFFVCNSYEMLFEGSTAYPIYNAFVSDAGYFSLVTGSATTPTEGEPFYLSEVQLFDADFNLVQHFKRGSATVSAPIANSGRTVTIVGGVSEGTVVDVYMIGDTEPLSSTALSGFPLAAAYTSGTTLGVVTNTAVHALSESGRVFKTVEFEGAQPTACHIDENGIAAVLETNRLLGECRVLAFGKRGSVMLDALQAGPVTAVTLTDRYVWLLLSDRAVCRSLAGGDLQNELPLTGTPLGIAAASDTAVRILYPAEALTFRAKG